MAADVADRVRDVDVEWDYGETKPAFRTTELIVLVVTVVAVLIASAVGRSRLTPGLDARDGALHRVHAEPRHREGR
jgi:hypothetical protein